MAIAYDSEWLLSPNLLVPGARPIYNVSLRDKRIKHCVLPDIGDINLRTNQLLTVGSLISKTYTDGTAYFGTGHNAAGSSVIINNTDGDIYSALTIFIEYTPRVNSAVQNGLIGNFNTSVPGRILTRQNGTSYQFYFKNSVGTQFGTPSNPLAALPGRKDRIIFRYDGSDMRIFVNGLKGGSTSANGTIPVSADLRIGAASFTVSQKGLNGAMHSVFIYDVALTDRECFQLMDDPYTVFTSVI